MTDQFIRDRISALRLKKGVSEYKMSLDLGHSKSYIQSISSGKAMPSLSEFLYICGYLAVTPRDFFDDTMENPALLNKLLSISKALPEDSLTALIAVAERLSPAG